MFELEKDIFFVDAFTSKCENSIDILLLFSNIKERKDRDKDREMLVNLRTRIRATPKFEGMLLCDMKVDGKSNDECISIDCTVTGVFYVPNVDECLADNEKKLQLTKATSAIVYPYLREQIADITKRLPLEKQIKLPPRFVLPDDALKNEDNDDHSPKNEDSEASS